ncbi:SMI1/KNR4 family protein [Brevibacillus sp. FIR094]|uniref:SMI1/KNR4 family protein n=1 Tax=Brevibacillus sp. FIR094 TaxID=3134809 RepID=UPI003D1CDF09
MVTWNTEYDEVQMENIKIVEKRLSLEFPKDYLECVLKYQGGKPSLCNIMVDEYIIVQFSCLLTFLAFDELDILDVYNSIKKNIPSGLIPFGLGSDSYLFCFNYRFNEAPTIALWRQSDTGENKVIYVCDSFTDLIRKLY